MKIKYLKLKNWLLVSMMSMLGLQACHSQKNIAEKDKGDEERPIPLMYGGPVIKYNEEVVLIKKENGDTIQPDSVKKNVVKKDDPMPPRMYGGPVVDYRDTTPKMPREPQVTVYGVPTVDYELKGRVVDGNGKPIKGMQVLLINGDVDPKNLPTTEHWNRYMQEISDTTDAQGNFEVLTRQRPWERQRVLVRDIDGAKNGNFEDQVIEDIEFYPEEPEGTKSQWNQGTKKAELTIKMKRKK